MNLDTHELAWAAGFFDGEGWAGVRRSTTWSKILQEERISGVPGLRIVQTDPYVLRRFQWAIGGMGTIAGPKKLANPNHSDRWEWQSNSWTEAQAITCLLWPWLSPVKRDQCHAALAECKVYRQRPRLYQRPGTHCRRGHEFTPENTYWSGDHRYCRICVNRNGRAYRARKKAAS